MLKYSPPLAAVTLCVATLTMTLAPAARAQFTQSGNAYYTTADYMLSANISGNDVFVGKTSAFADVPGTVTLTVATGATVGQSTNGTVQGGSTYRSLNVFGSHRANITGGRVSHIAGHNNSTTNISGGSVGFIDSDITSTTNISGGSVTYVFGYNTTNISGGTVTNTAGYDGSTTNISGGTLTTGLMLYSVGAKVNFVGTGLSFAYQSYGNTNPYQDYADFFKVSGTVGGTAKTYDLYIYNADNSGNATTPNSAPRQFTFNGAAPVVVPEAGTLALCLIALPLAGATVVRRRALGAK